MTQKKVPLRVQLAYSIGHFQNDLMASMWFSYLLVYFHQVNSFNNVLAGTILLIGQVADAIATPLVGYEADATSGCFGYTKRKSWHLFGTICTTLSFPFIFSPVLGASVNEHDVYKLVYYSAFVIIFQIGWASVQISHLSLIPDLTDDESEVSGLNGYRYAMTGVANLSTFGIVWAMLSTGSEDTNELSANDETSFRNIGFIVTGIGLVFSIIFHLGVPERKFGQHSRVTPAQKGYGAIKPCEAEAAAQSIELSTIQRSRKRTLRQWFTDIKFYQVALIYMCTRLFVNISQVYLPMYLTESIQLDKATIANVPLTCYAFSFGTATILKFVDKRLGRVLTYLTGLFLALGSSVFTHFIPAENKWMVYLLAALIGIGGALILITSLSFVADLIGDFTASGAFVFGAMSFTDKLANGVAVEIIQAVHPCKDVCCPACEPFYRVVQTFVPGGAAALALLGLATLACSYVSNRSKGMELLMPPEITADTDSEAPISPQRQSCANGTLPATVVEVHRDPAAVLNDGRLNSESGESDSESSSISRSPLIRNTLRKSRKGSRIC